MISAQRALRGRPGEPGGRGGGDQTFEGNSVNAGAVPEIGAGAQERDAEARERQRRKKHLIIRNFARKEDKNGQELIEEMIEKLLDTVEELNISKVERVDRPEANTVRITIENFEHKRLILSGARELKDLEGYNQVYIYPDLTVVQQKNDMVLRGKLKALRNTDHYKNVKVKIRRGQVIRIVGGGEAAGLHPARTRAFTQPGRANYISRTTTRAQPQRQ